MLSGCSGSSARGAAASTGGAIAAHPGTAIHVGTGLAANQVIARAIEDTPRSIDPALGADFIANEVITDLFEGLMYPDPAGNLRPGVATSWQQSADGLTWTFHLRPGARWSNGAPVTAQDFVDSWRRELDPRTGAQYAGAFATFVNGDAIAAGRMSPATLGVEATDTHTLVIHLAKPTPYLLDLLTQSFTYPVYMPAVRRYGDDWLRPGHMVSNGPFMLKDYILGNRITLAKNPFYWDAGEVHLTQVVDYIITDPNQESLRFMAGDLALTDLFPETQYPFLKRRLGDQVVTGPQFATYMLALNFGMPPFRGNPALREALTLTVDRDALTRYLNYGITPPAYTLMPDLPGYAQPRPDWVKLTQPQRDALARHLYQQAGYSAAHRLHLDLDTADQGPAKRHFFEAIAARWNAVLGTDIQVHEEEFKVLLQERELKKLRLVFDAWSGDYLDPFTYLQIFTSGSEFNSGGYDNPHYDALIDRAENETDPARRYRLLAQAESVLNDDVAYIPLYFYADRLLVKPYLKGWQLSPQDIVPSRYLYVLQHEGN